MRSVINPAVTIVLRLGAGLLVDIVLLLYTVKMVSFNSYEEVRSKEGKLDSPELECGTKAALLKKTKLLVLDEPTASLDTATDGMIQQTLAKHFTDLTVIMIAHRITSTVL
ncbi:putative ABC-type xenobiotic transporter [Helianthus anomalus]